MTPTGEVAHRVEGRTRIKVVERRGDATYFAAVSQTLASCSAVDACTCNPMTGSILIEHAQPLSAVLQFAREQALFSVDSLEPVLIPARVRALEGFQRIDAQIKGLSSGEADLRSAMAAGLSTLALLQLMRGQVLPPAATLLWYAVAAVSLFPADAAPFGPDSPTNGR